MEELCAQWRPLSGAPQDVHWLRRAIELSRRCPPSVRAYSVGAVIVSAAGEQLASGFSREDGDQAHAEEAALSKLEPTDPRLIGATVYSTLEPCTERRSRAHTCTRLILGAGVARVVIAWREPTALVADCRGVETLRAGGVEVLEIPQLEPVARAVNAHIPGLAGTGTAGRQGHPLRTHNP